MKSLIIVAVALLIPFASSANEDRPKQFQIQAKVYLDDKLISSPKVVTLDGSQAEISQRNEGKEYLLSLKVTPQTTTTFDVDKKLSLQISLEHKSKEKFLKNSSTFETSVDREVSLAMESESSTGPLKVVLKATHI